MSYLLINRTEFQIYIHWSDRILLTGLCLRDLVYSPLTTKYQRLFQLPVVAMAFLLLLSISSPTSYSSKPLRLSSLSIRIYSTNVTCKAWNSFLVHYHGSLASNKSTSFEVYVMLLPLSPCYWHLLTSWSLSHIH